MSQSPLSQIRQAYQQVLALNKDDEAAIDCFVSVLVATYHPQMTEPLWFYIIGPPGCGKTEIVRAMDGYEFCTFVSSLTENALDSGYSDDTGQDPSLLKEIDKKVMVFKDLTNIMKHDPRLVDKIWGVLRDAYDGTYSKASGKVGLREYRARFGVVAAVTDEIDKFSESHKQLGERFLSVRLQRIQMGHLERLKLGLHIYKSMADKDIWRAKIKEAVQNGINYLRTTLIQMGSVPTVDPKLLDQIISLADLLALMRTSAIGEKRDRVAVQAELPSRLTQQFVNLMTAHAAADGRMEVNDEDFQLLKRVMVDSLPTIRKRLVVWMAQRGNQRLGVSEAQLEKGGKSGKETVEPIIIQYLHSGVIETVPVLEGEQEDVPLYRLTTDVYKVIEETKLFEGVTDV